MDMKKNLPSSTVKIVTVKAEETEEIYKTFPVNIKNHLAGSLKKESLQERVAAWKAAGEILKIYGGDLSEVKFDGGKPYMVPVSPSISHSGGLAAAAVSKKNIGIDIQIERDCNYKKLAERMKFSKVNSLSDFFAEWVKYESAYKIDPDKKDQKFIIKKFVLGNKTFYLSIAGDFKEEEINIVFPQGTEIIG